MKTTLTARPSLATLIDDVRIARNQYEATARAFAVHASACHYNLLLTHAADLQCAQFAYYAAREAAHNAAAVSDAWLRVTAP